MDTTLEHARAKEVRQHDIQVDEIRRRARQWRLLDCDENTLEQMRHALIEEMEAVEVRLAEADERFSIYVDEGQPLWIGGREGHGMRAVRGHVGVSLNGLVDSRMRVVGCFVDLKWRIEPEEVQVAILREADSRA